MLKQTVLLFAFCICGLSASPQVNNADAIRTRKQVPVICYHQIRDWRASDRTVDKDYIIPPATFRAHMKMLADSGYHTILPDQLYNYLTKGTPLPAKPIMLTFDDTDEDQFIVARPEMKKYGFKGVFFILANTINKNKHYMTRPEIRTLVAEGNAIECHTWDHSNFNKYQGADWVLQLDKPKKLLEKLTGKSVEYFAFPYGLWNAKGLPELHRHGYKMAFQLSTKRDRGDPLMTVRRILDCGYWSVAEFSKNIREDFNTPRPILFKKQTTSR